MRVECANRGRNRGIWCHTIKGSAAASFGAFLAGGCIICYSPGFLSISHNMIAKAPTLVRGLAIVRCGIFRFGG